MSETDGKIQLPTHLSGALDKSNLKLRAKLAPLVPEALQTEAQAIVHDHYQEIISIVAGEVKLRQGHATRVQRALSDLTGAFEELTDSAKVVHNCLGYLGADEMPPLPRPSTKIPRKKRGVSVEAQEEGEQEAPSAG